MDAKTLLNTAIDELTAASIESARLDAQIILEHVLGIQRAFLDTTDTPINSAEIQQIHTLIKRRAHDEPLAYITGYKEFYGLDFIVNSSVLIPRPETESIVEYIVSQAPHSASVLELGTGSGCIAVALTKERPDVHITATDISADALAIAQKNAEIYNTVIDFIRSDMFEHIETKLYDVICANLPYVPTKDTISPAAHYEPALALFSGEDGLDLYKKFFQSLQTYLKPGGFCIIEHNPDQYDTLQKLATGIKLEITPIQHTKYVTVFQTLAN